MHKCHPQFLHAALLTLFLSAPVVALAQESLDAPDLGVVSTGQGKVRLEITAGPSGAPGGFKLAWMPADELAARGGEWPDSTSGEDVQLGFTGVATLNTWGEAEISFRLDPNQALDTEIGDLTDETGVLGTKVGELAGDVDYVFRVAAIGGDGSSMSSPSPQCTGRTKPPGHHCTFTQGYWKNHEALWPVSSLTLGSVTYTRAQLLQILSGWSVRGNGLVSLAHQLIAAKLNVANGANPARIAAAIAQADAIIGALVVPPIGAGNLRPCDTSTLTQTLDDWNNGLDGAEECDLVPAARSSWGQVKTLYR